MLCALKLTNFFGHCVHAHASMSVCMHAGTAPAVRAATNRTSGRDMEVEPICLKTCMEQHLTDTAGEDIQRDVIEQLS